MSVLNLIRRFDFDYNYGTVTENPKGVWVRYADYAKLEKELQDMIEIVSLYQKG